MMVFRDGGSSTQQPVLFLHPETIFSHLSVTFLHYLKDGVGS